MGTGTIAFKAARDEKQVSSDDPLPVTISGTVTAALGSALPAGSNAIGNVGIAPRTAQLTVKEINFSGSGDNTIIAAGDVGQTIKVYRMDLTVNAPTDLIIKDGVITEAARKMFAGGGIQWPYDSEPWSTGAAATAWKINSSNAVQVSGRIWYLVS